MNGPVTGGQYSGGFERMRTAAVIGTGMAGFGAAYTLEAAGVPFLCYDKNPYYGGHTTTIERSGFFFDEGGHISFTKDERIKELLAGNVRGEFESPNLRIDNYWRGYRITHPVQCNLNVLPTKLTVSILKDFIAASSREASPVSNYSEWLEASYGKTFAETFPKVYGRKYHTVGAESMTTDWLGPRMYRPNLDEILHGAIAGQETVAHYVDGFRYPSRGGYMAYLAPFAERYELKLGFDVRVYDPRSNRLSFTNGQTASHSPVISSMPLPELIPRIRGVPADVRDAARSLAFTTAVLITIGVGRDQLSDTHITYFYDEDVVFPRINFPHMFSPNNAPPGKGCVQAEVYFSDKYRPLPNPPEDYVDAVVADLVKCGILEENEEILFTDARTIRYANVIYDQDRAAAVSLIHDYLDGIGVFYCGRYGDWNHAWTDEAFLSGERAAQRAIDAA